MLLPHRGSEARRWRCVAYPLDDVGEAEHRLLAREAFRQVFQDFRQRPDLLLGNLFRLVQKRGDQRGCALISKAHRTGNFDESAAAGEKAVALNPNNALAHYTLGRTLAEAGRVDEAEAHIKTFMRLSPRDLYLGPGMVTLSIVSYVRKDYEGALKWGGEAMQTQANLVWTVHALRLAALAELGQSAEAGDALKEFRAAFPDVTMTFVRNIWKISCGQELLAGLAKAGLPES